MAKVIVVASGKGGTGKTMFTANMGASLALEGYKVVLIDMDTGLRDLDLYLGLENKVVYDVNDVMSGVCRIKQALIADKTFPGLYFMAASPKKPDGKITPLHMRALCDNLSEQFDFIIVDGPAGIDDNLTVAAGGAQIGLIIITPDYAASRDGEAVRTALREQGIKNIGFIINKFNMDLVQRGFAPSIDDIAITFKKDIAGIIQYDENIQISTNLGIPAVLMEGSYITDNFKKISRRVAEL